MNRGEGLRIAARAKHGTSGLFPEEKKPKKKQFSYKSRSQSYPVRKAQTDVDSKDVSKQHAKTGSQKGSSTIKQHRVPNSGERERSGNTETKGHNNTQKKQSVDFVKKNKTMGGTSGGGGSGKRSSEVRTTNTITLTQEQLNAILQSIGTASGGNGAPAIAIENGEVKVESPDVKTNDTVGQEKDEKRKMDDNSNKNKENKTKDENNEKKESSKKETDDEDKKTVASENVFHLLKQLEEDDGRSDNNIVTEVSSKPPSLPRTADSKDRKIDTLQRNGLKDLTWGSSAGMGNIGAIVGSQTTLTLQEKKRLEWKQALDEQRAEQKQRKMHEDTLRKSLDDNGIYHRQKTPQQAEKITPLSSMKKESAEDRLIPESSLGQVARRSFVPAAMRSNFFIGGSAGQRTDDYNVQLKRKEQQEWIIEIERQKKEAAEKKNAERREQITGHWMDTVTDKPSSRTELDNNQDNLSIKQTKNNEQPLARAPPSADILSPREIGDLSSPRGGRNTLTDPAELERRELANQKHVEHMRAIQEQVEEKQRLKREAVERRRREEAEEERRLTQERESLQKQFDMENEKKRRKEEAAEAKQKALEQGIINAQQEALAAKHAKRVQKLSKQGHDTANLRRSWDANRATESSPRQVVDSSQKHQPVQRSPPPEPLLMEAHSVPLDAVVSEKVTARESPEGRRDVGTCTINEQSTQTGFDYIHHNEALSPRLLEAIRQASAGIEYKARSERKDARPERRTKTDRETEQTSNKRADREEQRPVDKERQKERKGEKPKWGQNVTKKKISNSDKDLSKVGRGREERRRRRQEELLAEQERLSSRRRGSLKKRAPSSASDGSAPPAAASASGRVSKAVEGSSRSHSKTERIRNEGDGETVPSRVASRESASTLEGDFYPFLRSEDVKLHNQSVSVTPPVREEPLQNQEVYLDTKIYSPPPPPTEMDPLLNPERLKDSSHRQERILEQLSHLRQGLMMKQREIELGLSPTNMM